MTINFDPKNIEDLEIISKMISSLQDVSTFCENSLQNANNLPEIENNQELEELKKQREQENNEKEQSLKEKDERINELEEKIREDKKKFEEEKEELKEKLRSKNDKITELKEKLEICSISFGSDNPNEIAYFKVSGFSLEQSAIASISLYRATREGDIYKFEINTDGPILSAISNFEHDLNPFCDINHQDSEANTIKTVSIGKFRMVGSNITEIVKAKILLIKQ